MAEDMTLYNEENEYDYIVENVKSIEDLQERYPNARVEAFNLKYAFIHERAQQTENDENLVKEADRYGYTAIPKVYGLMDTTSVDATGAFKVRNQPALTLRGQGVIVGFVDTGIAFPLSIFQNEDDTTRLLGIWDQTIAPKTSSDLQMPFFAPYGTAYTPEQINQALLAKNPYDIVPSKDENGHGTFLAGIACGKADIKNEFSGMAPDSAIAVVKLRPAKKYLKEVFHVPEGVEAYSEIDIMNGVKYLLSLARYYQRPMIICIGLGTNQGGHDGRMPLSDYLSSIADTQSLAVVQAAGNEGNARRHYFGRVNGQTTDSVEIRVGKNVSGFVVELWGNSLNSYYAGVTSPGGEAFMPIPLQLNEVRYLKFPLEGSSVQVFDRGVKAQGGDYLVLLRFNTPSEGIWKISVASAGAFSTDYHMWMPISQFAPKDTYFLNSNPYTTLVSNACAMNSITAGMYNHVFDSLTPESGKGYTRTSQVKPDLLAPGVKVYGPDTDGSYTTRTGSSIAAAHTSGAAALIMEYGVVRGNYTYMDGLDIKTLMVRSASRKESITYPNRDWGYGTLDVYQIFLDF